MNADDGGHAFPRSGSAQWGMTLRDYFAGQALTGILAHPKTISHNGGVQPASITCAYEIADILLAKRAEA